MTLAAAEFCTGFVRQGVMLYFTEFFKEVHAIAKTTPLYWWGGFAVTLGGIAGGLTCGYLSDRLLPVAPPAGRLHLLHGPGRVPAPAGVPSGPVRSPAAQPGRRDLGGYTPGQIAAVLLLGLTCMVIFGVHGMLSGTASMDFGGQEGGRDRGRNAGRDPVRRLRIHGIRAGGHPGPLELGRRVAAAGGAARVPADAHVWVLSIIPFSVIGGLLMIRLWQATPLRKGAGGH